MPKGHPGETLVDFICLACGKPVRRSLGLLGEGKTCSRSCSARMTGGGPEARFWARVRKTDSCWLWTGARSDHGYGVLRPQAAPQVRVHRLSWAMHRGPIPEGLHVLHRCDVRSCVNPDHLFLGSQADNMADMWAKQRGRYGGHGGRPRLPAHLVCPDCGSRHLRKNHARHRAKFH